MTTETDLTPTAHAEAEGGAAVRVQPLVRAQDILAHLSENPGWVLQHCNGIRFHNWWWLRKSRTSSQVLKCNGNAARAASKKLKLVHRDIRGDATYAP